MRYAMMCSHICTVLSKHTGCINGSIGYRRNLAVLMHCALHMCFHHICPAWCVCRFEGPECNVDINECLRQTVQCAPNAGCINTEGAYNCTCWPGYTGTACFAHQQALMQQYFQHMTGHHLCVLQLFSASDLMFSRCDQTCSHFQQSIKTVS